MQSYTHTHTHTHTRTYIYIHTYILLQLCNLVGTWRILQRIGSHRWTTDDIVTAYIAITEIQKQKDEGREEDDDDDSTIPKKKFHYLDLGCGNASVLQMVSWGLLQQQQQQRGEEEEYNFKAFGIEARTEAIKLATRSLSFNIGSHNIGKLISLINGDFRVLGEEEEEEENQQQHQQQQQQIQEESGNDCNSKAIHSSGWKEFNLVKKQKFDLISGTPPYFRVDFNTTTTEQKSSNSQDEMAESKVPSSLSSGRVVTSAVINQG